LSYFKIQQISGFLRRTVQGLLRQNVPLRLYTVVDFSFGLCISLLHLVSLPGQGKKEQLTLSRELPVQFAPPYVGSGSVHIRWRSVMPKPQSGHCGLHADQLDHPPSTTLKTN